MNQAGIALLREFEGTAPEVSPGVYRSYWDKLGKVWTGPFGLTRGVTEHSRWTHAKAEADLQAELALYESAVRSACKIATTENQHAAMTCLAWNIGVEGFLRSTVLKCHNKGETDAAARAFALWNKAGGKVVRGLTRRRAAEAELYLRPVFDIPQEMPQKVDSETGARHSPMIWSGGITTAVGTVQATTQLIDSGKTLKDQLGDLLPWVLVAILGGVVIWYRIKQRKGGFA